MMTNLTADCVPPYSVLDPCLLGRPIHMLNIFAARFREDLKHVLLSNHRYWSGFDIAEVSLAKRDHADRSQNSERWTGYANHVGQIGFWLERHVLLTIFDKRYGRHESKVSRVTPERVTATEERLAVTLGRQLVQTLVMRLQADAQSTSPSTERNDFVSSPIMAPGKDCWTIRIVLTEVDSMERGVLWLTLDDSWFAVLLKGLVPLSVKTVAAPAQPLANRMQVALRGRLTSMEMPLKELLELRIGDVIPIRVGRADVLLDDARLFTAAVAEHKGKLCLTSFEDVE